MGISKEEREIHNALKKSQKEILKKMKIIQKDIHHHHSVHGGSLDLLDAFKDLGNTIKSGFEDKIIHPVENIINTVKENPTTQKIAQRLSEQKTYDDLYNKIGKYVTSKKGGLASDLLHKGVPMATGALAGAATEALIPESGPVGAFIGNKAGHYAGSKLADYIGNKTGTGLRKKHKKHKKYYSSSSSSESEEEHIRRPKKSSLVQLLQAHRKSEEKELKDGQLMLHRHAVEEMKALRGGEPLYHIKNDHPLHGHGIKKLVGTKRGNHARGDIVAHVMREHGCTLGEASKYVSKNNLY